MVRETGISTETKTQKHWKDQFAEAKKLMDAHGSWRIEAETAGDRQTIRWIKRQLQRMEEGKLPQDQVDLLQRSGIRPEKDDTPWMKNYRLAEQYHREHGDLNIPVSYVTEDGVRLGAWLSRQRSLHGNVPPLKGLTEEQTGLLEALGIEWNPQRAPFEAGLRAAGAYYAEHQHLHVPANYVR